MSALPMSLDGSSIYSNFCPLPGTCAPYQLLDQFSSRLGLDTSRLALFLDKPYWSTTYFLSDHLPKCRITRAVYTYRQGRHLPRAPILKFTNFHFSKSISLTMIDNRQCALPDGVIPFARFFIARYPNCSSASNSTLFFSEK